MLDDIAALTGGRVVAPELGVRLENVTLETLGRAERVVVDREHTTVIGGRGDRKAIDGRCQEIRTQIAASTSDYDKEKLEERLAKLSGGVAVIRVGAPSEAEMKSRHEAFDDAIHATRAAMAEGIVPGAGLALLRAIPAVEAEAAKAQGDERSGTADSAPRARGPGPADCRELRRRRRRRGGADARGHRQHRIRCRHRHLRRPDGGRASSTPPRWCGSRSRTPCRWPACCCSPRRR